MIPYLSSKSFRITIYQFLVVIPIPKSNAILEQYFSYQLISTYQIIFLLFLADLILIIVMFTSLYGGCIKLPYLLPGSTKCMKIFEKWY